MTDRKGMDSLDWCELSLMQDRFCSVSFCGYVQCGQLRIGWIGFGLHEFRLDEFALALSHVASINTARLYRRPLYQQPRFDVLVHASNGPPLLMFAFPVSWLPILRREDID
jgi:hypothetical protein